MGDVGSIADLIKAIFTWVTDPEGYYALTLDKKVDRLHAAAIRAVAERDYRAVDALLAELRRLSDEIT